MRGVRLEVLIATLALLASAAASIATVAQTNVVAKQLSASVWPYLTVSASLSPDDVELDVVNQGLGPALIRNATLTFDKKRYGRWRDVLRALADDAHVKHSHLQLEIHDFGNGSVVRPGESARIIGARGKLVNRFVDDTVPRTDLTVCYCSILQQCWTVDEASDEPPASVNDCGHANHKLVY